MICDLFVSGIKEWSFRRYLRHQALTGVATVPGYDHRVQPQGCDVSSRGIDGECEHWEFRLWGINYIIMFLLCIIFLSAWNRWLKYRRSDNLKHSRLCSSDCQIYKRTERAALYNNNSMNSLLLLGKILYI